MRKAILIAAAAGALVIGGTAFAYPGGPGPFGADRGEKQAEFADDLAAQLDGVSANEIEQALDTVREERVAEHRAEMAQALAGQLDGVSAEQVATALEERHTEIQSAIENGERPDRGSLKASLAEDLGASEGELEAAFEAKAEQRLNDAVESGDLTQQQADQIRERMENGPRGFGPGGPGPHGPRGFGPGGPGGPDGPGSGPEEGASLASPDAVSPTV